MEPRASTRSATIPMSRTKETLRMVTDCSVSRAATISFGTAFFEPRTGTVP